jgi:hypothetical protein
MAILRQAWTDEQAAEEVQSTATYIVELRNRIQETVELAQQELQKSAGRYAQHFNKKAVPRSFRPGDRVLLLLPQQHNKLQLQWQGPFEVLAKVGEADYRISVRGKVRLYHANLLKKYVERVSVVKASTEASSRNCVAVVIDETETESSFDQVPTYQLESSEGPADVNYGPNLSEDQRSELEAVARAASEILTDVPLQTNLEEFSFDLMQAEPVRAKSYPVPHATQDIIKKEIDDMLRLKVIEPACSPYSSPVVLVKKKDGKVRFCIDYRKLNQVTVFDAEPLPDVDSLFCRLSTAKYFSKLDLAKGYWQIPVKESDRRKTAFTTPVGQFQWTVMPFGLRNAGAVFSRMMRKLLDPLNCSNVSNFMDDVLIATDSWTRHLYILKRVLRRLEEANLSARPSKCYWGFEELSFLGHTVGKGCLKPEEDKLEKIRNALPPRTKKEVRSFIGLASYYRRFIPHFSAIALPLTDATKKSCPNVVEWTEACDQAFKTLKERLTSSPVIRLPDVTKEFVLRTDASTKGLGAVLMQEEAGVLHPVCYASRKLSTAESSYAIVELECLAVIWAVKKFEPYLYGRAFVLETDHSPLQYLQRAQLANGRLMRWAMALQPFQFVVRVIPGKENVGADFLSRVVGVCVST